MWVLFFSNKEHANCAFENTASVIVQVISALTEGGGINAATRLYDVSKNSIYRWQERRSGVKKTLLLFALTHQFLQQMSAGDERYTRGNKQVAPDESQGWTIVLMDRATRFIWDMQCRRKERKLVKNARRLLCHVIEQTGDLTLLTDGERRYGSLLFALCSEAVRTGKRGRPKQTLRQGVKVRLKNKGSQRHKRGPKRPT